MSAEHLRVDTAVPHLEGGRLVLGLSGWMDGGDVSTGTVQWLVDKLGADPVAHIESDPFYIYNFPGSMEIAALFRPHVKIEGGLVDEYEPPQSVLYAAPAHNLALMAGKEPHLRWGDYADCLFAFAARAGVSELYFVGSYAGVVPHSREPRMYTSVSDAAVKERLAALQLGFSDYEGPASFSTLLLRESARRGLRMANLVAEIPAYIQDTNPKCIETMVRKLAAVLELPVALDELRQASSEWEERVSAVLEEKPEIAEHVQKLEHDYDNEVFDEQMGDLKEWLQGRGIRVD